jgi:hypothetical protein
MCKSDIGTNAGAIWNLLAERGPLNIHELQDMVRCSESFVCYSIGWLLRENKIQVFEKNGTSYVDVGQNSGFEVCF